MKLVQELLTRFADVKLTLNLFKSEFGHTEVVFLGCAVGNGQVKPLNAKIQSIVKHPVPKTKKELMRFLDGVLSSILSIEYCLVITARLTNLLRKDQDYIWSRKCQDVSVKVKSLLLSNPVLMDPDFQKQFILMVDASDLGADAVLMQCDIKWGRISNLLLFS